ncbi:ribosomal protein S18-alanine N-acetyltransferase [Faecalicatena contorta]|uniref:ribosomal protein S18-alanine N-acetyltransferase n=1 Tax=Faecalicatena contorta TaxID=39482 RepID=UPI001F4393A0|nr:ribosomal protein S18-alanine N-acetyltransferase [Faecalicatena contorta]MCF2553995.1 ribosomal protein S18-alanine N-acetyltransferase [Faecalicatena contorta]
MLRVDEIQEEELTLIADMEQQIFTDAWSENSLRETWLQPQTMMLAVWADEVIAGYVILYYVLDEGEIARIAVSQQFRRQGAGSVLFRALVEKCLGKGISRILLDVRQSNQNAIAFYRSHGFTEDGVRKRFYDHPTENALLMSLDIGK